MNENSRDNHRNSPSIANFWAGRLVRLFSHMKHRHGTIEEWEIIAKQTLADPHASRSECLSALIGINQSRDEWLKESLSQKMKKAWTANLSILKKLRYNAPE